MVVMLYIYLVIDKILVNFSASDYLLTFFTDIELTTVSKVFIVGHVFLDDEKCTGTEMLSKVENVWSLPSFAYFRLVYFRLDLEVIFVIVFLIVDALQKVLFIYKIHKTKRFTDCV